MWCRGITDQSLTIMCGWRVSSCFCHNRNKQLTLIHSFTQSLIHSPTHAFICLFPHPLFQFFAYFFVRPVIHPLNVPDHSLTPSLIHSLTRSLTHPPTHSLTHPLTHSFSHPLTHSLPLTLIHSPTHQLTHSRFHQPYLPLSSPLIHSKQ
jgi:hypothetical protein